MVEEMNKSNREIFYFSLRPNTIQQNNGLPDLILSWI